MKKFWNKVEVKNLSTNSYKIFLDKKILKTPMKNELNFVNLQMANETANEWRTASDLFNTDQMIFYGLISTAIDRVSDNRKIFINDIIKYVDTDLICYRAREPIDLVKLQNQLWDPVLFLIEKYIIEKIEVFEGVMPVKQHKKVHMKIKNFIDKFSNFEISVLHRITNITGSVFLSLSILKGDLSREDIFKLSFLDELWQAEQWGYDEDSSLARKKVSYQLNRLIDFVNFLKKEN